MRRLRLCAFALTAVSLTAGTVGCTFVFDTVIDRTLGYRSPLGVRINATRRGTPLREEAFGGLEPGTSTLDDALKAMGAPQIVRCTPTGEVLEYYYFFDRQTRFVFRPLFFLQYGSMASYNFRNFEDGLDVATLFFDHQGTLKQKDFRKSAPARNAGAYAKTVFVP